MLPEEFPSPTTETQASARGDGGTDLENVLIDQEQRGLFVVEDDNDEAGLVTS